MKKNKLDFEYSDFSRYQLIGISSPLPAYKLCWSINQELKISLCRVQDFEVIHKQGRYYYPFYEAKWNNCTLYIIQNHGQALPMNKQFKIYDYFLILNGIFSTDDIEKLNAHLATIQKVQLIQAIDLKNVKEKENFLIEDL